VTNRKGTNRKAEKKETSLKTSLGVNKRTKQAKNHQKKGFRERIGGPLKKRKTKNDCETEKGAGTDFLKNRTHKASMTQTRRKKERMQVVQGSSTLATGQTKRKKCMKKCTKWVQRSHIYNKEKDGKTERREWVIGRRTILFKKTRENASSLVRAR